MKIFPTPKAGTIGVEHDPEGVAREYPIETDVLQQTPTGPKVAIVKIKPTYYEPFGPRYGRPRLQVPDLCFDSCSTTLLWGCEEVAAALARPSQNPKPSMLKIQTAKP